MRRYVLFVVCALVTMSLAWRMADPFEGTKWQVKVVATDEASRAGQKDFDDVLIFKANLFSSQTLLKRGFKPVPYEEDTRRFGPASFTAVMTSPTEGTAKWSGNIAAVSIRGDLVWTTKDGTELNYTYQGERLDK